MRKFRPLLTVSLVALAACDNGPQRSFEPGTHASHRVVQSGTALLPLDPAARAYLHSRLDVAALDRLLSQLPPSTRAHLVETLSPTSLGLVPAYGTASPQAGSSQPVETRDVRIVVRMGDSEQQKLLDKVWAPYWEHLPANALNDDSNPLPGRDRVRAQRRAQRAAQTSRQEASSQ